MTNLEFTALVGLGSVAAGLLGALTGLGGGVVIVPLLVLGFGIDLRYAVGTSLVSVLATRLRLDGSSPTPEGPRPYHVRRMPVGFGLMFVAGSLSGLLGIGSGALKVLAMDQAMGLPFKVSTATSNFMIGVTAAASAGVYLRRGWLDPGLTMPVMLGVLLGAAAGARLLP